ncbi:related to glomerulosclerosis protein Mpv17 [Cephalotrichum gorgonifer]|uniref:Related to glomerulosclerosis protein Mpv17 n=1 Tax=Cephalotrichum gorgonifer TaxID=2041049 RepID=A0AAE8N725_9PEZI|nr:related to glomerulosclerosis protein Mpv17 [Cephalotrichum gorgonifer]
MTTILKTVIQSACLKTAANLTAQLAARWQTSSPYSSIDWQRVFEFTIFGLIQAWLNCGWQQLLEDAFPTRPNISSQQAKKNDKPAGSVNNLQGGKINWLNVLCKLVLDQTLGLFVMNTTFLICTNALRLRSASLVLQVVREKIWIVIRAAWKLWPWVSICNFLWVPAEQRVLVASCVGFGWNIFLTFISMRK